MTFDGSVVLGMSLPHRAAAPVNPPVVAEVARRAEELGFADLWVSNNTLGTAACLDSLIALTWAAARTTTIRLGVSVLVLPIHHPIHVAAQVATLDHLSGGRAMLGAGLGREHEYAAFGIPVQHRVRRFTESVELIRALWQPAPVSFDGEIYQVDGVVLGTRPVRTPPIWFGGAHPAAIRRAAHLADGWMGGGGTSNASFIATVPQLRAHLEQLGRDPGTFPISKRVFLAVDDDPAAARAELTHWFTDVYKSPDAVDTAGIHGTSEQVKEQLQELVAAGATHLLLNPVDRLLEHTEILAELTCPTNLRPARLPVRETARPR